MLHGHGSNEQVGFDFRHQLPAELVIASIRAPLQAGGGYAWFPLDASLALHQIDDVSHAVLDWLGEQPPAPSVGVLGFSQGAATGIQTLRLAPERFDYAVVLSGFVVPLPTAGDEVLSRTRPPVFWGRGDGDPIIPSFLIPLTTSWLQVHATLTERVYPGLGHYVSAAELSDLRSFLTGQLSPLRQP
jgi:phospholipase/carboxylesterase